MQRLDYRSVFVSDVHLGTRDAKVEYLLDFLRHVRPQHLYLVGDILDLWKMRTGWHWTSLDNELVRTVTELARKGTRVTYIPGNHDELLRDFAGTHFNGIDIELRAVHETADGRRFLVLHGDEFDCVVMNSRWLAFVGAEAYEFLLRVNRWFNLARRRLGFGYWSLSACIKHRVKNAVNFIGSFERAVAAEARRHGADGVVCGHIHHARIADFDGVEYANCGDWVESCTALAEDHTGRLSIIHWVQDSARLLDHAPTGRKHAHSDRDRRVAPAG